MKRPNWELPGKRRLAIVLIVAASLIALAAVEMFPAMRRRPLYETRVAAARLAYRAMQAIKAERLRRGYKLDPAIDPARSGLLGRASTPVTSVPGDLVAKQTAVNPNFAAAVVDMLDRAGVRPGDYVAVGYTGSLPGMNIAVCAALEEMEVKPVAISSLGSSQFGANVPGFLWVDMERLMYEQGLISYRSSAASLGGCEDCALHMSDAGRAMLIDAIQRNDLEPLSAESLTKSIDQRMRLYEAQSAQAPIKAYINVGGGAASVGRSVGKNRYQPGLNLDAPHYATEIDSVMTRFMISGTPVIHLVDIRELADRYAFPKAPPKIPAVGTGNVYVRRANTLRLAGIMLLVMLIASTTYVWNASRNRRALFWQRGGRSAEQDHQEPQDEPAERDGDLEQALAA